MIVGSGFVCAAALAIGTGFVEPISATAGGVFDLLAVVSAVVFLGLIEGL
jgi:hypothetical protein